jgi:hypothetical protein
MEGLVEIFQDVPVVDVSSIPLLCSIDEVARIRVVHNEIERANKRGAVQAMVTMSVEDQIKEFGSRYMIYVSDAFKVEPRSVQLGILWHEIGHIVNEHLEGRRTISMLNKELEADAYASRQGYSNSLAFLLSRYLDKKDVDFTSFLSCRIYNLKGKKLEDRVLRYTYDRKEKCIGVWIVYGNEIMYLRHNKQWDSEEKALLFGKKVKVAGRTAAELYNSQYWEQY